MSTLPEGWAEILFGTINEFKSQTINPATFPDEAFELWSVPSFSSRKPEIALGSTIGSTKQKVQPNDVLVCKINPRINRVWQVAENPELRQIASSEWIVFRSLELVSSYFQHFFSSPSFREKICTGVTGVGGSLTRAQPKQVAKFPIPLAPLNEQKRIADKLDRLLAKVDACRERCDRIPLILKRFRQSVLAAATSGELTDDWHVEYTTQMQVKSVAKTVVNSTQSSASYEQVYLRDLVQEPLRNGKSVRDGDGTLVLRLSCLKHGRVDWTEVKRGDWGDIDVNRFLVKEGDFLVARGNGSRDLVGRGSLVVEEPPVVAFPDTMIRVRPNKSSILPRYLQIIWDGNEVRAQIELTARTTAGIWKIAQGDLENLLLPVPKIHEQQEIVRRVEKLFAFADRLESRYQTARAKCDQLTPALLEKAFQGELVPQDPNDEPASVLLERIKSLRFSVEAKQTKPQRCTTAPSR